MKYIYRKVKSKLNILRQIFHNFMLELSLLLCPTKQRLSAYIQMLSSILFSLNQPVYIRNLLAR